MGVDSASLGLHIACMKDNNSYTFLKSLTPTLIVAASILVGLLGGAKIISEGVIEANRFQFSTSDEGGAKLFDSATGVYFRMNSGVGWVHYPKRYLLGLPPIGSTYDWVKYLEDTTK